MKRTDKKTRMVTTNIVGTTRANRRMKYAVIEVRAA